MATKGILEARGALRQVESGLNTLVRLGCLTDEQGVRLKGELNCLVDMASARAGRGAAPASGPASAAAPDPPDPDDDLIDLEPGPAAGSPARPGGAAPRPPEPPLSLPPPPPPEAAPRYEADIELENSREWLAPEPAPRAAAAARPPAPRGLGDSRWTRGPGRDTPPPASSPGGEAAHLPRRQASARRASAAAAAATTTTTTTAVAGAAPAPLSSSSGSPPPPASAAGLLVCPFWLAGKCRAAVAAAAAGGRRGGGAQQHGGLVHEALGGLPVERLECPFWRDGGRCTKAAAACRYEHRPTRHGRVAPYPHGLSGRARKGGAGGDGAAGVFEEGARAQAALGFGGGGGPGGYVGVMCPAGLVGEGAVDSEMED